MFSLPESHGCSRRPRRGSDAECRASPWAPNSIELRLNETLLLFVNRKESHQTNDWFFPLAVQSWRTLKTKKKKCGNLNLQNPFPPLSYLSDLLCDVGSAILHLGGAEELHPGSRREGSAIGGAPAGRPPALHRVRVGHLQRDEDSSYQQFGFNTSRLKSTRF